MSTLYPLAIVALVVGLVTGVAAAFQGDLQLLLLGVLFHAFGVLLYHAEMKARAETTESPQRTLSEYASDE